jgi:hypothetical protein
MYHIHTTISAAVVPLAAYCSGTAARYLGQTADMPEWVKPLLGPLGTLVGAILAIAWLIRRLDRSEEREVVRQKERDEMLRAVIECTHQSTKAVEQNSQILARLQK